MKKFIAIILTFCLILCAFPLQAMAYPGDIWLPGSDGGGVVQKKLENGALALQNDYLRVTLQKTQYGSYLTTIPTAVVETNEGKSPRTLQYPQCTFITYEQGYGIETSHYVHTALQSMEFVQRTPNGNNPAIKAEYALTIWRHENNTTFPAAVTVYHELVKLQEGTQGEASWGVLTTVGDIRMQEKDFPQDLMGDYEFRWEYQLDGFTGMGHYDTASSQSGPALKMSRTTVREKQEQNGDMYVTGTSTDYSVITRRVDDLSTYNSRYQAREMEKVYITEVYVDSYPWANPFVGLSSYSEKGITGANQPIRVALPSTVTAVPSDRFDRMWVECTNFVGRYFDTDEDPADKASAHYLWGFRNLYKKGNNLPSKPDQIDFSITAKRLAVFRAGNGVTVEYVADDAALTTLKKKYNNAEPVALISGDYTSKNGEPFKFTGNAAMLSPSVTATWDSKEGGKLLIHKDGRIEQKGVHLSAPTFKFYQPKSGSENDLKINLDENGFTFGIVPEKNDAIIAVDIPYATAKLKQATADVKGNLVFSGHIGFRTIFPGAEFTLKKLGYGLQEKTVSGKQTYEFKVNGVHATGSFDTAELLSLELASVKGEVNTFKGKERYAFELELNAFDLFETEAKLALVRSKKDGSLIPDELWFYVAANPGIVLVPPIPIGQLNGGGAGFKNLAATVNGDYFAIPPLKLRGALTGTYLHLVKGRGDVVLGPSEISLKGKNIKLVGTNLDILKEFGYTLKLEGQEREYKDITYKGIYFAGAEELKLGLLYPNFEIIEVESSMELGAFGGVDEDKKNLYLGIGANGKAEGKLLIPNGFPFAGKSIGSADMELIIGGQTTTSIAPGTSVSESMREAFKNIDPYLGVMAQGEIPIFKARAWVLIPHIVKTNFKKGAGWDLEIKIFKQLSDWDWGEHGVTPVVRSAPQSLFMPLQTEAAIGEVIEQENAALQAIVLPPAEGESSATITVNAETEETPYILLDFGTDVTNVTEKMIQDSLTVNTVKPIWTWDENATAEAGKIYAASDLITNNKDNQKHRVVLLRLPSAGDYSVDANNLTFTYEKASVTPFEKLAMIQGGSQLSGQIKYAEPGVQYTLRTYLGAEQGEATYLVDEQEVTDTDSLSVNVPTSGTLAPTGSYYVTTFLMMEKQVTTTDEEGKTKEVFGLASIDRQQFDNTVSYTNTNQPAAPTNVELEATGNEVMRASWNKVDNVSGYAVKIYQKETQKDGSESWKDTGFGYDVDANTTYIDMAMTVGGNAVSVNENGTAAESVPAENLSADQTYKVGVRAYKEEPLLEEPESTGSTSSESGTGSENGTSGTGGTGSTTQTKKETAKYYSKETCSDKNGTRLLAYTPLNFDLKVNEVICSKDDYNVYHAYVGGQKAAKTLTITCDDNNATFSVTRMDKETGNTITKDANTNTFNIPNFTGSLMLCVEGVKDKDTTRKFLLVSTDDTPPVLTLSSAVFYADPESGAYTITGTADAGSQILYGGAANQEPVTAAGDGSFRVTGAIEDSKTNSASITLAAKDSAGNESASQLAMVSKQMPASETPSGGSSYVPSAQQPTIQSGEGATVALNADGTAAKIVLQEGYELVDVTLNGVSQGKVTEIKGLKTGDKLVVITKKQETLEQQEQKRDKQVKKTFDALKLKARSKKLKNGNIRISFAGQFAEFEALAKQGYTIKYRFYRSTKKSSGYKRMFLSEQPIYINTYGKRGTMYYYKAIALAYNKDGKLIAKTELKQCQYAKRRWTK